MIGTTHTVLNTWLTKARQMCQKCPYKSYWLSFFSGKVQFSQWCLTWPWIKMFILMKSCLTFFYVSNKTILKSTFCASELRSVIENQEISRIKYSSRVDTLIENLTWSSGALWISKECYSSATVSKDCCIKQKIQTDGNVLSHSKCKFS